MYLFLVFFLLLFCTYFVVAPAVLSHTSTCPHPPPHVHSFPHPHPHAPSPSSSLPLLLCCAPVVLHSFVPPTVIHLNQHTGKTNVLFCAVVLFSACGVMICGHFCWCSAIVVDVLLLLAIDVVVVVFSPLTVIFPASFPSSFVPQPSPPFSYLVSCSLNPPNPNTIPCRYQRLIRLEDGNTTGQWGTVLHLPEMRDVRP